MRNAVISCVVALAMGAGTVSALAEIRIAVAGPMTGTLARLGAEMRNGVTAAVATLNANGGLLGEEIVLEIADDSCSEDRASAVANQLAGADVAMVVGHLCSAAAIAAAEVYAAEGIIQIAPGAPDPRFTDFRAGDGVFRLFGREDEQGATAAAFLATLPSDSLIAVIDDQSAYGDRLADSVRDALLAVGRMVALSATYDIANPGYPGLVESLRIAGIDAVFVGGRSEDIAEISLEIARQDFDPILLGGDVLASPDFLLAAGDTAEGTLFTLEFDPRDSAAALGAIAAIEANGQPASALALYAYAAVEVWAAAVIDAGTAGFPAVAASIGAQTADTAIGPVAFNESGDLLLAGWAIHQWLGSRYVVYEQ